MSDKAGIPTNDCQYINFVYVIFSKITQLPFFCHCAYYLLQSASECCDIKGVFCSPDNAKRMQKMCLVYNLIKEYSK